MKISTLTAFVLAGAAALVELLGMFGNIRLEQGRVQHGWNTPEYLSAVNNPSGNTLAYCLGGAALIAFLISNRGKGSEKLPAEKDYRSDATKASELTRRQAQANRNEVHARSLVLQEKTTCS